MAVPGRSRRLQPSIEDDLIPLWGELDKGVSIIIDREDETGYIMGKKRNLYHGVSNMTSLVKRLGILAIGLILAFPSGAAELRPRVLVPMEESVLRDKIEGAWLGQMIGVTWGFPTEFYARYIWQLFPDFHQVGGNPANIYARYEGGPIPLDELPAWDPSMINGGYTQDDLYVEVPFMEAMRDHGPHVSWARLGESFAASQFPLYHANNTARRNLRAGVAPPLSGHYSQGGESDDIDWQIEADFVGLMNPRVLLDRCTLCADCVAVCPTSAIVVRDTTTEAATGETA